MPLYSGNKKILKIMNNNNQVLFDAVGAGEISITSTIPFCFKSNGTNLTDYTIYGNTGGVGEAATENYVIPIILTKNGVTKTVNIPITQPLGLGDSISLSDTNIDIETFKGTQTLTVNTTVQPFMMTISGIISYVASAATKDLYTINYYSQDGNTLLHSELVVKGNNGVEAPTGLTKTSSAQYNYNFVGWNAIANSITATSNILDNIQNNLTVYAAFSETTRTYSVYFYNDDTILETVNDVPYGGSATYTGTEPTKTDYEFAGWSPLPSNITADTSCYAQFEPVVKEITDSWATISARSAAGTAQNYYSVGDCKAVELNGTMGTLALNETLYVYILGFDHNSALEGTGITFGGFKTNYGSSGIDVALGDANYGLTDTSGLKWFNMNHRQGSSSSGHNYGGWKGCDMRYDILGSTDTAPSGYGAVATTANVGYDATSTCATNPVANTLMSCLPSDLRSVMKPMTKYTDNTGNESNAETNVTASVDYLPLLSEYEVFGTRTYANQYEQNKQAQYAYYASGNSKEKYHHTATSSSVIWWVRSPHYSHSHFFCLVNNYGTAGSTSSRYSRGVAPIFLIGTAPTTYTVTYYSQDGQTVLSTETVEEGHNCIYSTSPTKASDTDFDYSFVGWSTTTNSTTATAGATENIQQNTNLYAAFSKSLKGDTISDSWEEIIANCDNGIYASKYQVGDLKTIDVGSEGPVQMQIVAIDTDLLASDNTKKAPITWISKQLLKTYKAMHGTSSSYLSDWANCDMRTYLRGTVLPMLPSVVQNGIKEVTKYTCKRTGPTTYTTVSATENIWLPSYREVSNATSNCETSGVQYNSIFTDNASRVKSKVGNNAYYWWKLGITLITGGQDRPQGARIAAIRTILLMCIATVVRTAMAVAAPIPPGQLLDSVHNKPKMR